MGGHSMYPGYHGYAPDAHAQHQGYAEYNSYAPHMNQYPHSMPRPATMHVPHVAQHAQHAPVRTQGGHSHHGAVHTHLMNALHSAGVTNKDINSMCKITNLIGACCSVGGHAGAAHMGGAHIGAPDAQGKKKKNKKNKATADGMVDGMHRPITTLSPYNEEQRRIIKEVNELTTERLHEEMPEMLAMNKYHVIAFILQRRQEHPHHNEGMSLYEYMKSEHFNPKDIYMQEAVTIFPQGEFKSVTMEHYKQQVIRARPSPHDPTAPRTPRTPRAQLPIYGPSSMHNGKNMVVHTEAESQFETQHLTFGAEVPSAYRV